MASKNTKRILTVTGGLLVFTTSVFATYAVFKLTDIPSQLIANLNTTIVEKDDQKLIENVEANQKILEEKYATKNDLQTQNAKLADQLEKAHKDLETQKDLLQKEQNYVKQRVASDKMTARLDQKVASEQLKNVEMVEPIFGKLVVQVDILKTALKELLKTQEESNNLHKDLELKIYNFQKGLGQKSNFKEFLLYIFGLKLLWGLFTGYSRTFYPYKERNELLKAFDFQKQKLPEINQKLEENKQNFVTEIETIDSVLKRIEDSLNFDTKIQANFVAVLQTPLLNAIGKFRLAFEEYLRAKEISSENVKSFIQGYRYLPYVSAEFQKPTDTYYFWESVNRNKETQLMEEARANLRNVTKSLNETLETTLNNIKKLQNEFFDRDKLFSAIENLPN